jgi:hypothetical protein
MSTLVLFPHPYPQPSQPRNHQGGICPWNTNGDHKRKFLFSGRNFKSRDGTDVAVPPENGLPAYVDAQGNFREDADLAFWGEYEPDTFAAPLPLSFLQNRLAPTHLHYPISPIQSLNRSEYMRSNAQNTDPFVFGDRFKYFICRQRNRHLRNLVTGDVILYGSSLGNCRQFILDTVFVVSSRTPYTFENPPTSDVLTEKLPVSYNDATKYKHVALNRVCGGPNNYPPYIPTCYGGATFQSQVRGMYSFAPAMIWENQTSGFNRLDLTELLNRNRMSPPNAMAASRYILPDTSIIWRQVNELVFQSGLVAGVHFPCPPVE